MQIYSYILLVIDMYIKATLHRAIVIIKTLLVFGVAGLLIVFSENCAKGASKGIEVCLNVLVPSLFPFMVLSSYIVKSGLCEKISRPFQRITELLFGVNGNFATVIFLSMIGGYPVGAKAVSTLVKNGGADEKEAEKVALFAVCAGPGFIVNFVGVLLYQNATVGFILLVSQILSVVIIGIVINLFDKNKMNYISNSELCTSKTNSFALVESTVEGSKGILNICAFVVLFSVAAEIINSHIADANIKNIFFSFLEVCNAVNVLSKTASIELVAFSIGFGGLCVHFQIFSTLVNIKIDKILFFSVRIIQGVITALITHFCVMLFPIKKEVFSTSSITTSDVISGNVLTSIALVGVSICFLYTLKCHSKQH